MVFGALITEEVKRRTSSSSLWYVAEGPSVSPVLSRNLSATLNKESSNEALPAQNLLARLWRAGDYLLHHGMAGPRVFQPASVVKLLARCDFEDRNFRGLRPEQ